MNKSDGYIEDVLLLILGLICFGFLTLVLMAPFLRWETSEQNVSGIVYNTKNDKWPVGNTSFSVRASEATYVNEDNKSSFCLPPNSPYKQVINKAASNKDIKVVVKTKKVFTFVANPFTCMDNVTVEKVSK